MYKPNKSGFFFVSLSKTRTTHWRSYRKYNIHFFLDVLQANVKTSGQNLMMPLAFINCYKWQGEEFSTGCLWGEEHLEKYSLAVSGGHHYYQIFSSQNTSTKSMSGSTWIERVLLPCWPLILSAGVTPEVNPITQAIKHGRDPLWLWNFETQGRCYQR